MILCLQWLGCRQNNGESSSIWRGIQHFGAVTLKAWSPLVLSLDRWPTSKPFSQDLPVTWGCSRSLMWAGAWLCRTLSVITRTLNSVFGGGASGKASHHLQFGFMSKMRLYCLLVQVRLVFTWCESRTRCICSQERVLHQVLSTGTALYCVLSTIKEPQRTVLGCCVHQCWQEQV